MDKQNEEIVRLCNEEIVSCLQTYRMMLQDEMEPEDWTEATCPIIATLSDVCDHMCLSPAQRAQVLGVHNTVLLDLAIGLELTPAGLELISVAEVV